MLPCSPQTRVLRQALPVNVSLAPFSTKKLEKLCPKGFQLLYATPKPSLLVWRSHSNVVNPFKSIPIPRSFWRNKQDENNKKKQKEALYLWPHSPWQQKSLLSRLKKSNMYNHIGTFKSQPEQDHLCLVVYKHGATPDYPGAGNSRQNVIGRWEQKKKGVRSEEEGRAGEHWDNIYKPGKMLSKDYLHNKDFRLVQVSTQPNILSHSSRKQTCEETVCEKSQYKT